MKKLSLALVLIFAFTLQGCQKEASPINEEATSKPSSNIPSMTRDNLVMLSDNQWDELERRCLGLASDPTCALMSESSVKSSHEQMIELHKLSKEAQRAVDELNAEKSH